MYEEIRKFNRFYTRVLGLINQYTEESPYTLLEAQILYEIYTREGCVAHEIGNRFSIDKGYLSRIINKLTKEGLIFKKPADHDKRKSILLITPKGMTQLNELIESSNYYVQRMLEGIPDQEQERLIEAMQVIQDIFNTYKKEK
ncbi:MarR family winged helix-turn-helix transcriptional regulator [Thalassobacillus devorans]|uniref:MarR family winged helix-turn-helix transcriptional regulator n=1 Tax=Thalassobacillus devorans TaxID=279813 RepID=UPI0006844DA8|nr:MarR family winged helix-turn-helix transcriptional regulator [Thalassobacillus devorans]